MTNNEQPLQQQVETQMPVIYRYVRTNDPDATEYKQWRVSPISFGGVKNEPYSDEQILDMVRKQKEAEHWYTIDYWRDKGLPQEQVEVTIGDSKISIYNYDPDNPLTDEHISKSASVFQEMASHFPNAMSQIRYIMIDNRQLPSAFGDPEIYPTNGMAYKQWNAFQFYPRGLQLFPYRIEAVSNFEGVFAHELTHLIQREFEEEWGESFQWGYCSDYPDDWELRPTPDGEGRKWFNKQTNEMSPQGQFPLQPDNCVTYYAKINMGEDICESMVAYIYSPDLLKRVAPKKYDILRKHDALLQKPDVRTRRVPKAQIKLPEVEPQDVLFYVEENDES